MPLGYQQCALTPYYTCLIFYIIPLVGPTGISNLFHLPFYVIGYDRARCMMRLSWRQHEVLWSGA